MNILDYVKNTTRTFEEMPLNPVDSLVLSQLSYARLEFAEPKPENLPDRLRRGVTVADFFRNEWFEKIFCDGISDSDNMNLMAYAVASRRYRNLKIRDIVGDFDKSSEKQFGAMIFRLDANTDFVAFRGTDGSMLGWKEDFNLSFMNEVPSQSEAVEYLERNYGPGNRKGRNRRFYVGGHSKGGNLAVYAALMCSPEVRSRILRAYSLDGPGFRDEVQEELDRIQEKSEVAITKLVPRTSVVGMMMQNSSDYQVVQSDAIGIMQHFSYSWQVQDSDFIYLEEIDTGGKYMNRTVHDWLQSVPDEKRKVFINSLFDVLAEHQVDTLQDLKEMSLTDMAKMIASLRNLEEEDRTVVADVLKSLAGAALPKFRRKDNPKNPEEK